ncbi:hypothetical protein [Nitrosopumilus ureiphilus]|uniref:Uncharacterized protein n=1 Tax=Nitrosopumilus ureiphilus TaxID=1470067 RepID=A0A7D5M4I9_9ARCH|nr:hypothetical protein [Nitrosopumilus ureiphilus]QLH06155.1 hypothetical protein C5F50_02975 [Nitrosopumilus ureiphilus]
MLDSPNFDAPAVYNFLKFGERQYGIPIPHLLNLERHFPVAYELLFDDNYFENIVKELNNIWVTVDKNNNSVKNTHETYIDNDGIKLPQE